MIKKKLQLCIKWILDGCGGLRQSLLGSAVLLKAKPESLCSGLLCTVTSSCATRTWSCCVPTPLEAGAGSQGAAPVPYGRQSRAGIAPWPGWCLELGCCRASKGRWIPHSANMCSSHLICGNQRAVSRKGWWRSLIALYSANRIGVQKYKYRYSLDLFGCFFCTEGTYQQPVMNWGALVSVLSMIVPILLSFENHTSETPADFPRRKGKNLASDDLQGCLAVI